MMTPHQHSSSPRRRGSMLFGSLKFLFALQLLFTHAVGWASDLLMVRSAQPFAETMLALQTAIGEHGYTVSRVQHVDVGLTTFGYETDKYRVVFFGKPKEHRKLIKEHPELIPYLPLKVAIFAEEYETLVVASDPAIFSDMYPDKDLEKTFSRWSRDMRFIFEQVRRSE